MNEASCIYVRRKDEHFQQQCQQIRENVESMTGINVVFRPLCFGDPEMALLEAALSANVTIKFIALVLAVELRPGEAQTLGNILRTHTTVETLIVRGAPNDQLQRLWSGVFSNTTSLKTINLHGLSASAVSTLAHARTDHSSLITNFGFVECTFSAEAVEDLLTTQFNPPFQRNGKSHRLIVHECIFETVEEKRRFARALARTTSWQSFVFEDEKRLDKETAAMFAQAIAANHALEEVGFIGLGDDELQIMTNAIERNHYLMGAELLSKNHEGGFEQECEKRVGHSISMNRAGRLYLQESIQRPGDASLEEFWLSSLSKNINKHPLVYSWIRNYPDIFVRVAFSGEEDKEDMSCKLLLRRSPKPWDEEGRLPRKHIGRDQFERWIGAAMVTAISSNEKTRKIPVGVQLRV